MVWVKEINQRRLMCGYEDEFFGPCEGGDFEVYKQDGEFSAHCMECANEIYLGDI